MTLFLPLPLWSQFLSFCFLFTSLPPSMYLLLHYFSCSLLLPSVRRCCWIYLHQLLAASPILLLTFPITTLHATLHQITCALNFKSFHINVAHYVIPSFGILLCSLSQSFSIVTLFTPFYHFVAPYFLLVISSHSSSNVFFFLFRFSQSNIPVCCSQQQITDRHAEPQKHGSHLHNKSELPESNELIDCS
jgi:hypothetical protein